MNPKTTVKYEACKVLVSDIPACRAGANNAWHRIVTAALRAPTTRSHSPSLSNGIALLSHVISTQFIVARQLNACTWALQYALILRSTGIIVDRLYVR